MNKFYKVPMAVEKETEKAILDENLGWLPKSKVEVLGDGWMVIPAWIIRNKGISGYMMKNAIVVTK